eukprot:1442274-Rhodomonas_salina.3
MNIGMDIQNLCTSVYVWSELGCAALRSHSPPTQSTSQPTCSTPPSLAPSTAGQTSTYPLRLLPAAPY